MQKQHWGYSHHSGGHKLSEHGWHHSGRAGRSTHAEDVYSPHHWPRSDISWPKRYQACPLGCWTWSYIFQNLSCTHGHSAFWQCGGTTSSWGHHVSSGHQYGDPTAYDKFLCICTERKEPSKWGGSGKGWSQLLSLWWCFSMKSSRHQGNFIKHDAVMLHTGACFHPKKKIRCSFPHLYRE